MQCDVIFHKELGGKNMQVSYNLLKEYVDIDISPEELTRRLTINGIILESEEKIVSEIEKVVVGKIIKIEPHPENERLSLCEVDIKEKHLHILCGASNMKVSDKVPVAMDGAKLPGIGIIKSKKIRNVFSEGMLCSASELGIESHKSTGILILDEKTPLGENINKILDFNDTIFDFEIHSNRPDLMSVIGIAREVAAITEKELKIPIIEIKEEEKKIEEDISVDIEAEDLCPRYCGRIIKNVRIEESPLWLKWKLKLLGIRPINNIVDITNYILMETGQPLHAFDLDLIHEKTIIVRRSKTKERMRTLDDTEREIPKDALLITDSKGPIALAGIMGGMYSEISQKTKNVFLESAYFHPVNNRRTTSKIGLRTDASNRFEKGIDKEIQIYALNRATDLMQKIAHGKVSSGVIDTNKNFFKPNKIKLRIERIKKVLGLELDENKGENKKKIVNILEKLAFKIEKNTEHYLEVIPPSFREDVEREIDVIEEIARIYGYDRIKPTLFRTTISQEGKSCRLKLIDRLREVLVGCGYNESITYSFISPEIFDKIRIPEKHALRNALKISNPLTRDHSVMKTTLLSGLLDVVKWNTSRQAEKVKIFEIGKIYIPEQSRKNGLPLEKLMLSGAVVKIGRGDIWEKSSTVDIFDVKGILDTIFADLKMRNWKIVQGDHPSLHPLKNARILIEKTEVAVFGEIHPEVIKNYRIPGKVFVFEIDFDNLFPFVRLDVQFKTLPKYPSLQRDLALVVSNEILSQDIVDAIKSIDDKIIKKVILFDVFKGSKIDKGFKSMAYSIIFQAEDRTLTDVEIDDIDKKIREKLMNKFHAKMRE